MIYIFNSYYRTNKLYNKELYILRGGFKNLKEQMANGSCGHSLTETTGGWTKGENGEREKIKVQISDYR